MSYFDLFKQRIVEQQPKTFADFHAIVCKVMPDAGRDITAYNRCYDLMELAWETARQNELRNVDNS